MKCFNTIGDQAHFMFVLSQICVFFHILWSQRNKKLLAAFFLLLPIQFVLLRFGEPHGTTDAIGVLLTIAQCPLLAAALYPWPARLG